MRTSLKAALIAVAAGTPAFFLTPILFPSNPNVAPPAAELIPYFMALGVAESLFFGVGVAFLVLGLPTVRKVARVSGLSPWPTYLAIGYLTASWWPHLGMHRVAGVDFDTLIVVDYVFHLPYIISAGILAHFFYLTLQAAARQQGTAVQAVPVARRSRAA
jgi:hypothetical protein